MPRSRTASREGRPEDRDPTRVAHLPVTARVRSALSGRDVREVAMFGGLSFMVDGGLVVAARGDGSLLVRVDPAHREELIARPGAGPAGMKNGRVMGAGWLEVAAEGLETDEELQDWLDVALAARPS